MRRMFSVCVCVCEDGGEGNVTNAFIKSLVGNLKVLGFKGTSAGRLGSNIDLVVIISRGINIVQD